MSDRIYKVLEKSFIILYYVILTGLFLKGEVFKVKTEWFSVSFTSVKNFIFIFIILWILIVIAKKPIYRMSKQSNRKPHFPYWILSILAISLFSIFTSINHIETINAVGVLFIYVFWFLSIKDLLIDEKTVLNTIFLMLGIAAFVNLINLYFHNSVGVNQILEKYPFWDGKNAFGLFLVMALCISGCLAIGRHWVWLAEINTLMLIPGIILTYSRSAWLAFAAAVLGVSFLKFKRAVWIIVACVIIVFIFSPAFVSERFKAIFSRKDINANQRMEVWKNTAGIIKDRPITGTGLGTFNEAYRKKYPNTIPLTGQESRPIRHVHNLYLQILEENGIIGLVFFILLIIFGFIRGIKNIIKEDNQLMKSIRYGSLIGIIAFLVYSITDCTTSWQFIGDSFSHVNLIWVLLWALFLRPISDERAGL